MTSVEADCADPIAVVRRIQVSALELPASSFQPPASSFIRTPGFLFALVAGSWKLHGMQISGRHISSVDEPSKSAASLQPPASSCDPEKGSAFASASSTNSGGRMQDYRKLHVWQKAHKLAVNTYALSEYFRRPEAWKLRDQIFDAAISIPANIAEGRGRGSDADFRRFLWYSNGSCNEFETEMLIAHDANFLPSDLHARYADDVCEVRRMLTSLIQTVG
jgi:four helix bundle protein